MSGVKSRLSASGDRVIREVGCWRIEQIRPASPGPAGRASVPQRSRSLSLWLNLLRDRPGSPAYRIRPASEVK
jgi:hypothetical protein